METAVPSDTNHEQEEPAAEEQPAEHPAEDAAEDAKDGESEGGEEEPEEEEEEPKPEINVRDSFPHSHLQQCSVPHTDLCT